MRSIYTKLDATFYVKLHSGLISDFLKEDYFNKENIRDVFEEYKKFFCKLYI